MSDTTLDPGREALDDCIEAAARDGMHQETLIAARTYVATLEAEVDRLRHRDKCADSIVADLEVELDMARSRNAKLEAVAAAAREWEYEHKGYLGGVDLVLRDAVRALNAEEAHDEGK